MTLWELVKQSPNIVLCRRELGDLQIEGLEDLCLQRVYEYISSVYFQADMYYASQDYFEYIERGYNYLKLMFEPVELPHKTLQLKVFVDESDIP